jgi:hypothetical protein
MSLTHEAAPSSGSVSGLPHSGQLHTSRVTTAAVHAQSIGGFQRGYVFAKPGTLFTVDGQFNPSAKTVISFSDRTGRQFVESPISVTASSVTGVTPVFLHPRTLQIGSGGEHVAVVQQAAGGPTTTRAIYHLQSLKLPQTDSPPGSVLGQVLTQAQTELAVAIQSYQALSATTGGRVQVGATRLAANFP